MPQTEFAHVIGWKLTLNGTKTAQASELKSAEVQFWDHEACKAVFRRILATVTDNMICAGGGPDACQEDSGGPLTCRKGRSQYLCGITSWGTKCNHADSKHFPEVYTDVRKYETWIRKQMDRWHLEGM